MKATIIQGSVFDVLPSLKPGSVDCVVTSPPYWKLRSYLPKDHPLKTLELGSEPTPAEFVANMVRVFRLARTAMADHATCWLNIGDSYSTGGSGPRTNPGTMQGTPNNVSTVQGMGKKDDAGIPAGNLCLIPQRLAIALQDDGWFIRSVIVWHKPAPMPASLSGWAWRRRRVKTKAGWDAEHPHPSEDMEAGRAATCFARGRKASSPQAEWADCPGCKKCSPNDGFVLRKGSWPPTSSWEPILLLAKSPNYYADGESVKTPASSATVSRDQYTRILDDPDEQFAVRHDHETVCDGGANLRDVWTIASEALKAKHYAAFPTELVHRCLKAGTSSKGYCVKCGAPWARVMEGGKFVGDLNPKPEAMVNHTTWSGKEWAQHHADNPTITTGWRPSCNCHFKCCPKCGFRLEYSGNSKSTSRSNHGAAVQLQGVPEDVLLGGERSDLLQCGVQDQRPAEVATDEAVPDVQEDLPPTASADVLQHLLRAETAEGSAVSSPHDNLTSMQTLRERVPPEVEQDVSVQQAMFREVGKSGEAGEVHDDKGVRFGAEPRPPESEQDRVHDGTSPGDGTTPGEVSKKRRSRASQKRREERQSPGESRTDGQEPARSAAEASEQGCEVPSLLSVHSTVERCPRCQTNLIVVVPEPRRGVVLDPFAGSGRVGIEARRLGLDFIGAELNPEYADMARRILYDACPLFSNAPADEADREAEKGATP